MKEVSENLDITLRINSKIHQFTIRREQEKMFREAETLINASYNNYRQRFPGKEEDLINAIVMLEFAVQNIKNKNNNDTEPLAKAMTQLTREIEEVLGEKNSEKQ